MNKTTTTSKNRTPRWLRWVLVISLALNLMVAGVIGGWVFKGGKHGRHHPPRLEHIGGPLTRALSHEDRRAIGRKMHKAYREGPDDRAAHMALMQALIAELRADPLNREAVAAHMAGQREFLADRLSFGQSLLIDRLEVMDPADRATYADRLAQELERRRNK